MPALMIRKKIGWLLGMMFCAITHREQIQNRVKELAEQISQIIKKNSNFIGVLTEHLFFWLI